MKYLIRLFFSKIELDMLEYELNQHVNNCQANDVKLTPRFYTLLRKVENLNKE